MDSSGQHFESSQFSRDYKCPCGKTYLSNAAIFTHIRQKHGGKAPGQIQKPVKESKPRGRPPLNSKKKGQQSHHAENRPNETHKNNVSYQEFNKLFQLLNQGLPYPEPIPIHIWETIDTFKRFDDFIDMKSSGKPESFEGPGVCIGVGLSEFLETVSKESKPHQFSQTLILFILLLQYCMDETNDNDIIQNSGVQEMVMYMNSFINYHIKDYAELLGLSQVWALQNQNIIPVFNCFIEWLKWKGYTQWFIAVIY